MTVTVYSKPQCAQCEQTKKQLDRIKVPYTEIDVTTDAHARKLVEASGKTMLPMVVIKDGKNTRFWHGFRYDEIKGLTKNS